MSKIVCRCSEPDRDWEDFIKCQYCAVDNTIRWLRSVSVYYCIHCGRFWLEEVQEVDFLNAFTREGTDWILLEGGPVSWEEMWERKYEPIPEGEDGGIFIECGDNITMKQHKNFAPIVIIEKAQQAYEDMTRKGKFFWSAETWNADIPPIFKDKWIEI